MSDTESTQPEAPQAATPAVEEAPARETDWKAEARKWEARAKENSTAAARLAEIEEASKSEAQKAAERLAALEAENAAFKRAAEVAAWSKEIVAGSHIPADVLRGDTREELEAHFEALKSLIPEPQAAETRTVPTIGKTPDTPRNVPIADLIASAEAAGDRATVAALKAMQLGSTTT